MNTFERDLQELGTVIAWPPTPDVAAAVAARIGERDATERRRLPRWRALSRRARFALAALLAAAVGALAVSPAGAALLRWIGIGATIRISEVRRLPVPAQPDAGLGETVSLERALVLADFRLRVSARPLRVRFSPVVLGGAVTLDYRDATVTQFAGTTTDYVQKVIAPPVRARNVRVNGDPGVFLSGGPTQLFVGDRRGEPVLLGGARAGFNVLLWESGGVGFRLQTRRDLAGALRIAATFR